MVSGGGDITNQLEVEDLINSSAVMAKKVRSIALTQPKGIQRHRIVKISILANHSSFFFLKTTVHFNSVFLTNLTFFLRDSNDVCGFLHCTEYRFNYFLYTQLR